MLNDYEISKLYNASNIEDIYKKLNIDESKTYQYGKYIAKIDEEFRGEKKGKLVLVTSTSPNKAGIGKTTVTIGLSDSINNLMKTSIACIREPSLGPVFGLKGGASGGGYSQAYPMDEINLEFTGDFHAITSINNLISSAIDNCLFYNNELNIDKDNIYFTRAIDINDRSLRNIKVGNNFNNINRKENFKLTPASEIMAILALSDGFNDFLNRVENITFAKTKDGKLLKVKDLNIIGSIAALAKKLINPNLVQSLKGNPIFIHGGPFANIAHGTNTIIADNLALSLSDYVITEAGFGSDMGAEKFMNLVAQTANLEVSGIVLVTTINSLKEYSENSLLKEGVSNLINHIKHLKKYNTNLIVTLNKYTTDTEEEIKFLEQVCIENTVDFEVNDFFTNPKSNKECKLTKKVINFENNNSVSYAYKLEDKLEDKINKVVTEVYNGCAYQVADDVKKKIQEISENEEYTKYPICFAKNPTTFSGDVQDKFKIDGYEILITDVLVQTGAKFIVLYVNEVLTLPGLGKEANMHKIKYNKDTKEIEGLS